MKIKVCGMTSLEQLHQLSGMRIDLAGLIFYPKSPRYIFNSGLTGSEIKKANLELAKVGVFVNASYDEVMKQVESFGLDMVQLHGDEAIEECEKLSGNVEVIKAFRFTDSEDISLMKEYSDAVDKFLFDTGASKNEAQTIYGGTGHKFNWARLKELNMDKPFFLSGGIEPTDVEMLKNFMKERVATNLFAVDINSRFESSPGVKDMNKVKQFAKALNL